MLIRKILSLFFFVGVAMSCSVHAAKYVILISVDGLRAAVITELGPAELPNFYRFRNEGMFTDNARTDFDYTQTIPNHSSMITGRPVLGINGHNYTSNGTPASDTTLHNTKGSYVGSVFDVVHDHGLSTALYCSKSKFILFEQSYNAEAGAVDTVGVDNGKDKIDVYYENSLSGTAEETVDQYLTDMAEERFHFSMLHLRDPDAIGHGNDWKTPEYDDAVRRVDGYLGEVFDFVESNLFFKNNTSIILTADHGGAGNVHSDATHPDNYTIPFHVWGADVPAPGDLYELNPVSRSDPGEGRPDYSDTTNQPIRNSDAANLALQLLGLPGISDTGAIINQKQDLAVALDIPPIAFQVKLSILSGDRLILEWGIPGANYTYTVETRNDLHEGNWNPVLPLEQWPITQTSWSMHGVSGKMGFYRVIATPVVP